MYNKVILVGNLTRDIEIRYLQSGTAVAKTAIATNRKFKGQDGQQKDETCFIDITLWGRSAEVANQYLRKGSKILVEGRLAFEQWTDPNGQTRSKHSITVENMTMLSSKGEEPTNQGYQPNNNYQQQGNNYQQNSNSYQQQNNYQQQNQKMNQQSQYQEEKIPEIDIDETDIPF
jgi:single-strand DNA-binding protein